MSQLDWACNIPEAYAIAKSVPQQRRTSRISPWHRSHWLLLLLLVALFFAPLPAPAQLYTGSVTGVVTDSSGATIPAVKITLVDQGKGYSFTATTDNTGRYLLRSSGGPTISAPFSKPAAKRSIISITRRNSYPLAAAELLLAPSACSRSLPTFKSNNPIPNSLPGK